MQKKFIIPPFFFLLLVGFASTSFAVPVDLSAWDTFGPVTFDSGGYSATLSEDETGIFGPTSLENWIFFIPEDAAAFSFDYSFTLAPDNEDYFDFYFSDMSAPVLSVGGLNESLIADVISGSYSVPLVGLRGDTLPVIFGLQWGFGDWGYESFVTISNVELATAGAIPIPEPGTVLLLATGLTGLVGFRKRVIAFLK